jgi:hypothetical protein
MWKTRVKLPARTKIFFCSPEGLWRPPSLLSNSYREIFLAGKAAEA